MVHDTDSLGNECYGKRGIGYSASASLPDLRRKSLANQFDDLLGPRFSLVAVQAGLACCFGTTRPDLPRDKQEH